MPAGDVALFFGQSKLLNVVNHTARVSRLGEDNGAKRCVAIAARQPVIHIYKEKIYLFM